jgi:hypothetical protein
VRRRKKRRISTCKITPRATGSDCANTLYDYGIEITGGYTTEPAGNPVGGIEHGFTYLHNFGFGVLFDLQKIAGISDTTFLVTISQRSGRGLTQDAIGNAIRVQQIFGGGQTYRLVQMRFDQKLLDDRLELSYGRITTTADFLTSQFYCQFVNNGICGQPPAPFFNCLTESRLIPRRIGARLRGFKRRKRLTPNSAFTMATRHRATIATAPTLVLGTTAR